ncbi:MAG: nitronate monooxygenase [Spirochaetia bacterium]|jgi:NAD(P)H-dependent flavin oxidoreductase YrpB (nitropropane dioxygenase family)|nr:nitronate monooxygenase [Spirochaetia bacterium]
MEHPSIIQGGMGVGVSDWRLARSVSIQGALGVVSGTALDTVMARRLQQGDQGGHMRRGLLAFPDPALADRVLADWFRPDGTADTHDFASLPLRKAIRDDHTCPPSAAETESRRRIDELTVAANFVEVYLAKEAQPGLVGINYLEKVQLPNPASIYGAMLAGVDYILMGAGIPLEIPRLLDRYAAGEAGDIQVHVEGAPKDARYVARFDPAGTLASPPASLKRPAFLAIVSSYILAATMLTRASGRVDGIIVENQSAGGHNAPPRGVLQLDEFGEPIYGPKDDVDYAKMVGFNIPFWLGGSYGMPDSLRASKSDGATGIQVGTLFAFCRESGLLPELKLRFLKAVQAGKALVFTHPDASPTGYPFKIAMMDETLSEKSSFVGRVRVCNVGLLRQPYDAGNGHLGYRCPAEAPSSFVKKGGAAALSTNARCLCNALLTNIGLGMSYAGARLEKPLVTVGKHLESLRLIIGRFGMDYSAVDVLNFLHPGTPAYKTLRR